MPKNNTYMVRPLKSTMLTWTQEEGTVEGCAKPKGQMRPLMRFIYEWLLPS